MFPERPYPMFVVNSRGVVMFSEKFGVFVNDVTKFVCIIMIDLCIKCSESQMACFLVRILCASVYGCIFLCVVV